MQFKLIPVPAHLQTYVECIRIGEHAGMDKLAINVCLNGLPGLVFQHQDGQTPLEMITTPSAVAAGAPTLFVYGQMTEPGVMHYKPGSFATTQIVFKPHALHSLLGLNAAVLTNNMVALSEFSAQDLDIRLLEAHSDAARVSLLIDFLTMQHERRDPLVEASLCLIYEHGGAVSVRYLLGCLNISERQFEKRFQQVVGLSPQFYIRVKRFDAAMRLLQKRQFARLTDLVHRLNYYDQSHFIRDIKAFSGSTPRQLLQKGDVFEADQRVIAYLEM